VNPATCDPHAMGDPASSSRHDRSRVVVLGFALVCALPAAAVADDDAKAPEQPDAGEPPIQEIAPDEPEVTPPPKPEPKTKATAPAPAPVPAPVYTMDEVTVPRNDLRFGINFFGDTSFAVSPDSPHSAFTLGALGIRLLGELSPSLSALAEFALETVESEGPISDVEQVAIRWRRGPSTFEVGRVHTDLGFWNTAYHHGLWLQPLIERPHAVRFEDDGGIVPVHWVGANYTLQTTAGPGKLTLVLGVGNGRGSNLDDVRVLDDTNDAKSTLLKLKYKAGGTEVGVSAIYDVIAPEASTVRPALPNRRIHELVGNGYVVHRGDRALAIAEAYVFQHVAGDQSWTTLAAFAVVGYAVTPWLTPYAAIDTVGGANDDPFFTPDPMMAAQLDLIEGIAGVRFETSTWSALKLELRLTRPDGDGNEYAGIANWSFGL